MARTSTYLNFPGTTEEAFRFYRGVFGTEFQGPIARMGDVPPGPGMPVLSEKEKRYVMHVVLPILGGHLLMATDVLDSMERVPVGRNVSIMLEPDTRADTDRLFAALAAGGEVTNPLQDMFWGGYFGSLRDRYGVQWMFNCTEPRR